MDEYINREEVLEILSSRTAPWNGYQKVRDLPAADVVERKKGKWEKVYYGNRPNRCSECRQKNNYRTKFCPNCGADMRGEDNG